MDNPNNTNNNNIDESETLRRRIRNNNNNESRQTNTDEYFSTDSSAADSDSNINNNNAFQPKKKKPLTKKEKFTKRFASTWIMIFGFFFIIYLGHTALCIFVGILQAMGFREIASLGTKPRKEKQLPGFYLLHWHLFITSVFFLYGQLLMEHLLTSITHNDFYYTFVIFILRHHAFLTFLMIVIGLISFVLSLTPGYYKYQFKQLGWCMAIIMIVVGQSTFVIANIMDGLIWFIVPSICIITNDIMAYMSGLMCGRKFIKKTLIKLSPNKTWEGAIGGAVFTVLICTYFSTLLCGYQLFVCPKIGFSFSYPNCEIDTMFVSKKVNMMGVDMYIAPFQYHALVFAIYASLIGPFGGFFASGFKRAFKLKDFSHSIPGHGGISDRMDCQIIMCVFVYVYRQSFVKYLSLDMNNVSLHNILGLILKLEKDDQVLLLNNLKTLLNQK